MFIGWSTVVDLSPYFYHQCYSNLLAAVACLPSTSPNRFCTLSTISSGPSKVSRHGISRSHCDKSLLLLFRSTVQNIDPPCRRKSEQRHQTFCGHKQLHHYHFYSNCKRTHLIARFASTLEIFSDSRSPLCPINTKTTYATLHF